MTSGTCTKGFRAALGAIAVGVAVSACAPAPSSPCPAWGPDDDFSGSERVPQPPFEATGRPLDLALAFGADDFCLQKPRAQADFFMLEAGDGKLRFTRFCAFELRGERELYHRSGLRFYPPFQLPADHTEVVIDKAGLVRVGRPGGGPLEPIGIILVARFKAAAALRPLGEGLFEATPASGEPLFGRPTIAGHGRLHQGQLDRAEATRATPPDL